MTKIIAGILCLCMVAMDAAYAAPGVNVGANPRVRPDLKEGQTHGSAPTHGFTIPASFGTLEESHHGTNGKTILYIQDAHDSLEAQENIAKIIHHLVENYGVKTVFEEGYEGAVPSDDYFGFIKDPGIKERVSYFLMDKLRIGGAEFAHINRKNEFDLIGADSIDLHLENIEWYRESAKRREEIAEDLEEIEKHLKKLIDQYFPKEIKEWLKLKKRLDEGKIDILDYVKRIVSLRDNGNQHVIASPAKSGEAISEFGLLRRILEPSRPTDPSDPMGPKGNDEPNFDSKILLQEIERFEHDFADSYLTNSRDKKILQYYQAVQLLKRLNKVEITSKEYRELSPSWLDTQSLAEFLAEHSGKSLVLSKRWESSLRHAVRFYEIAEQRDQIIEETLNAQLANSITRKPSILVFGGFHKDNIKSILQKNGFSYFVMTPKITGMSEKHHQYYTRLMSLGAGRFEVSPMLLKAARAAPDFVFAKEDERFRLAFRSEVRELAGMIESLKTEGSDLSMAALDLKWQQLSITNEPPRSEARLTGGRPVNVSGPPTRRSEVRGEAGEQRTKKQWQTREQRIRNIHEALEIHRSEVMARFRQFQKGELNESETEQLRQDIYAINAGYFRLFGLSGVFPYYNNSYIDALMDTFQDSGLGLNRLGFRHDWSTPESAIATVRYEFSRKVPSDSIDYGVLEQIRPLIESYDQLVAEYQTGDRFPAAEAESLREKIYQLHDRHFSALRVDTAYKHFNNSFKDTLIVIFKELTLDRLDFENDWTRPVDSVAYVFQKKIPGLMERYQALVDQYHTGDQFPQQEAESLRSEIYKLQTGHLRLWNLYSTLYSELVPQFHGHYTEVISAVFPELHLNPLGFELDWKTRESGIASVKYVFDREIPSIMERYRQLEAGQMQDESDIRQLREEIYQITKAHLTAWGVGSAMVKKVAPYFKGSFIDVLGSIFSDAKLGFSETGLREYRARHRQVRYRWSKENSQEGLEQNLENIRDAMRQYRPDLLERYRAFQQGELTNQETTRLRRDIYAISQGRFLIWKLRAALDPKSAPHFKGSYINALMAVFADLHLDRLGFQSDYSTPERVLATIRYAFTQEIEEGSVDESMLRELRSIIERYDRLPDLSDAERDQLVKEVYGIQNAHFDILGLTNAFKHFGGSKIPTLQALFADLHLDRRGFGPDWSTLESSKSYVQYQLEKAIPYQFRSYEQLVEQYHFADRFPRDEAQILRQAIYQINSGHFGIWNLQAIEDRKTVRVYQGKIYLALQDAFPQLNLNPLGFGLDWSTRKKSITSIRYVLSQRVPSVMERFEALESGNLTEPEQVAGLRRDILQLTHYHFEAWGLTSLFAKGGPSFFDRQFPKTMTAVFKHEKLALKKSEFARSEARVDRARSTEQVPRDPARGEARSYRDDESDLKRAVLSLGFLQHVSIIFSHHYSKERNWDFTFEDIPKERYRAIPLPEKGGEGQVYVAKDESEKGVFIKTWRKGLSPEQWREFLKDSDKAFKFFLKDSLLHEMETLIKHPGPILTESNLAPKVLAIGLDKMNDETYRLYLKLKGPEDAEDLKRAKSKLKPETKSAWLGQIAEAIQIMHQGGLIHNDIKPENIVAGKIGKDQRAQLIDFGLSTTIRQAYDSYVNYERTIVGDDMREALIHGYDPYRAQGIHGTRGFSAPGWRRSRTTDLYSFAMTIRDVFSEGELEQRPALKEIVTSYEKGSRRANDFIENPQGYPRIEEFLRALRSEARLTGGRPVNVSGPPARRSEARSSGSDTEAWAERTRQLLDSPWAKVILSGRNSDRSLMEKFFVRDHPFKVEIFDAVDQLTDSQILKQARQALEEHIFEWVSPYISHYLYRTLDLRELLLHVSAGGHDYRQFLFTAMVQSGEDLDKSLEYYKEQWSEDYDEELRRSRFLIRLHYLAFRALEIMSRYHENRVLIQKHDIGVETPYLFWPLNWIQKFVYWLAPKLWRRYRIQMRLPRWLERRGEMEDYALFLLEETPRSDNLYDMSADDAARNLLDKKDILSLIVPANTPQRRESLRNFLQLIENLKKQNSRWRDALELERNNERVQELKDHLARSEARVDRARSTEQVPRDPARGEARSGEGKGHSYGDDESRVSRNFATLDSAYRLIEDIKADPLATPQLLLIGVGRGYAAMEMALRFPNIHIVAVNKEETLWNDERIAEGMRFLGYQSEQIKAARERISVEVLDVQNISQVRETLGDALFDYVIFEPYTQMYFKDKVEVIEEFFNNRVKKGGVFAFVIDAVLTSNYESRNSFGLKASNIIKRAMAKTGALTNEIHTAEFLYLKYRKETEQKISIPLVQTSSRADYDSDSANVSKVSTYYRIEPVVVSKVRRFILRQLRRSEARVDRARSTEQVPRDPARGEARTNWRGLSDKDIKMASERQLEDWVKEIKQETKDQNFEIIVVRYETMKKKSPVKSKGIYQQLVYRYLLSLPETGKAERLANNVSTFLNDVEKSNSTLQEILRQANVAVSAGSPEFEIINRALKNIKERLRTFERFSESKIFKPEAIFGDVVSKATSVIEADLAMAEDEKASLNIQSLPITRLVNQIDAIRILYEQNKLPFVADYYDGNELDLSPIRSEARVDRARSTEQVPRDPARGEARPPTLRLRRTEERPTKLHRSRSEVRSIDQFDNSSRSVRLLFQLGTKLLGRVANEHLRNEDEINRFLEEGRFYAFIRLLQQQFQEPARLHVNIMNHLTEVVDLAERLLDRMIEWKTAEKGGRNLAEVMPRILKGNQALQNALGPRTRSEVRGQSELQWATEAQAIENVENALKVHRSRVWARYENIESLSNAAKKLLREEIYAIEGAQMKFWGISKAFDKRVTPYFGGKVKGILTKVFNHPDLALNGLGFGLVWKDAEGKPQEALGLASVEYVFRKEVPHIFEQYERIAKLNSDELKKLRAQIYAISSAHFIAWGLSSAVSEKTAPYFEKSHHVALTKLFSDDRLKLDPLGWQLSWVDEKGEPSLEAAKKSIRFVLQREVPQIMKRYEKIENLSDEEIERLRQDIYRINSNYINAWGLGNTLDQKAVPFFKGSYKNVLMAVFDHPKLKLNRLGFKLEWQNEEGEPSLEVGLKSLRYALKRVVPDIMERFENVDSLEVEQIKKLENDIYQRIIPNYFSIWGIAAILNKNTTPYFEGSYVKALEMIFDHPKLKLNPFGFALKFNDENGEPNKEIAIKSIRYVLKREVPNIMERYERIGELDEHEIEALRRDIYNIKSGHINAWGLTATTNRKLTPFFNGSYFDVLEAVFDDERLGFDQQAMRDYRKQTFEVKYRWKEGFEVSKSNVWDAFRQNRPDLLDRYENIDRLSDAQVDLLRDEFYSLKVAHLNAWGLSAATKPDSDLGGNFAAVMTSVFDHERLGLHPLEYELKWSDEAGEADFDIALESIGYVLHREIPDIMDRYARIDQLSQTEIDLLREDIYQVRRSNAGVWGLSAVYSEKSRKFFGGSHKKMMAAVFSDPRLELNPLGFGLEWQNEQDEPDLEVGRQSILFTFEREIPEIMERYRNIENLSEDKIELLREDLYAIDIARLRIWGLRMAFKEEDFPFYHGSYKEMMLDIFNHPKLKLNRLGYELEYNDADGTPNLEKGMASLAFVFEKEIPTIIAGYKNIANLTEDEIAVLRSDIYNIKYKHFQAWGLQGVLSKTQTPYFKGSYKKALLMFFDDERLKLDPLGFGLEWADEDDNPSKEVGLKSLRHQLNEVIADVMDRYRRIEDLSDEEVAELRNEIYGFGKTHLNAWHLGSIESEEYTPYFHGSYRNAFMEIFNHERLGLEFLGFGLIWKSKTGVGDKKLGIESVRYVFKKNAPEILARFDNIDLLPDEKIGVLRQAIYALDQKDILQWGMSGGLDKKKAPYFKGNYRDLLRAVFDHKKLSLDRLGFGPLWTNSEGEFDKGLGIQSVRYYINKHAPHIIAAYDRIDADLSDEELVKLRKEIYAIKQSTFKAWELVSIENRKSVPYFQGSYRNALLAVFDHPRLGLELEEFAKRSEMRSLETTVEKMTIPSGVIIDAFEVAEIGPEDLEEELNELLILAQRNKAFDIYVDQLDRYPLTNHKNQLIRALMAEPNVRGLHHRDQLKNKNILIQMSFFDQETAAEDAVGRIKEKIQTSKNVIPLKGEAGAVTTFLKAAESALVKASEIKEYFEESVLSKIAVQKNGRWHVFDKFLATVRSELRSAYAIAVSA